MKYLISLTILFLAGCAKGPNQIDPAFQPLYNQFVSDAAKSGIDLSGNQGIIIQFATLEQQDNLGEIIGECSNPGYGNNTVSIDTNFWNVAGQTGQKILMYHELGHCVLSEGHVSDPDAIMNPLLNNPEAYYTQSDWSDMLSQLFSEKGDYPTNVP